MASVKLITPQNKPKYFKLTANIVVNGEKKRYYSRFEFDPKVLRTAKSRYAAAMAAAVRFESEMQQGALPPKKPEPVRTFAEVAEEYIQSCKARKAPSARLSGNYDANKNKANTTNNKETYLRKLQTVCPWFTSMEVNKISKGDYERLMDEMEVMGPCRRERATLRPGDLLFAISSSGRSSDIVNCAITAQKNGVTVISLSDFAVSPLTKNSDINLFTTPRNASLFQNIDMPLVVSQITVIDALYSCCCAKFPPETAQIYQSTRLLQKEEKLKI